MSDNETKAEKEASKTPKVFDFDELDSPVTITNRQLGILVCSIGFLCACAIEGFQDGDEAKINKLMKALDKVVDGAIGI